MEVEEIKKFFDDLKNLKSAIKKESTDRIHKVSIRKRSEGLSRQWFAEFKPKSISFLEVHSINQLDEHFQKLLRVSGPSNLKKSYESILKPLIDLFKTEVLEKAILNPPTIQNKIFSPLIEGIEVADEKEYLKEAIECADLGYHRAAAVLGWAAAINRIHKLIEIKGFNQFNITSARLASLDKGRFKRFSKTYNIHTLSELREVFDTDILWIIEGMGLIDSNQHTRLRSCFDLRNQSAHPGEAPITEYNLLSFFSDIREIILTNKIFSMT